MSLNSFESEQNTVKLNVGGTLFQCHVETLQVFSDSKLALLTDVSKLYFFDRSALLFSNILDGCRKGSIHISKDTCGATFREELAFWEISSSHVAPCCLETLYSSDGDADNMTKLLDNADDLGLHTSNEGHSTIRQKIWSITNDPRSSKLAFLWNVFIALVILASLVVMVLMSLPEFCDSYNDTELAGLRKMIELAGYSNDTIDAFKDMKPSKHLGILNVAFYSILTLDMLISFVVCPNKKAYICCTHRILLTLAYVSFWSVIGLDYIVFFADSTHLMRIYVIMRYFMIFALLRLFDIARHIPAFMVMRLTFKSSKHELNTLLFLLVTLVCVFGMLLFVAEMSVKEKDVQNVLSGMYMALITLTTVGYGDYCPVTPAGHVIAALCAVCGILVLALPVGVIASKFFTFYNYHTYAIRYLNECDRNVKKK